MPSKPWQPLKQPAFYLSEPSGAARIGARLLKSRTAAAALILQSVNAFSNHSSPPRRTEWEWGLRFADQSLLPIAEGFGFPAARGQPKNKKSFPSNEQRPHESSYPVM